MYKTQSERGGKNTIGRLLGRRLSFAEIDRMRAAVERDDRVNDQRRWAGARATLAAPAQGALQLDDGSSERADQRR